MREIFGKTIVRLAEKDERIVLITCDVHQNMDEFKIKFPDRFFDFGLTEQATVGICAGLASQGLKPVFYSITPFVLERPFEQIKIDIDEMNLPVMLIGYDDYPTHGPTHRALNPKGLVSLFKNIDGFFPNNSKEAEKAMLDAYLMDGPSFIHLKKDGLPFI
jgi:transketolase